mgnify:CR=1 FL=1
MTNETAAQVHLTIVEGGRARSLRAEGPEVTLGRGHRNTVVLEAQHVSGEHLALRVAEEFDIRIILDSAAEAYLLIDATTGTTLVEKNADEQLPPASLTKMMTAYVLAAEIEEYKRRNLLKTEIPAAFVGMVVSALLGPTFEHITGAHIPIDGGNDRVI